MTLTELEVQMLLKIGEKYQKQDGSFVYGAVPKIKEEAAAFIDLSLEQIRDFFKSRRRCAKRYRRFLPDAVLQHIPINMLYGYGSVQQPQRHPAGPFIQAQQEELEKEFACLQLKKDEIEKQRQELEETVTAFWKVNQEREMLELEVNEMNTRVEENASKLSVKAAECEALKKKLNNLEEEYEKERIRKVRYDPWSDPHELAKRCQKLEQELDFQNESNAYMRSKCNRYKEYIASCEDKLSYYKAECEKKWNAAPEDSAQYWRDRCIQSERDNEALRSKMKCIIKEQGISRIMLDVIERAIYIDTVVVRIVEEIVSDRQLLTDVLKAGLLAKIRFIGQYWFIEKYSRSSRSIGNVVFYKPFIKQWDDNAREFVTFRNNCCHEWSFLQDLKDQRDAKASNYFDLYGYFREELKPLEEAINNPESLNSLKSSRLLSDDQVNNRLKELRLA
jgi:hypothetical protein